MAKPAKRVFHLPDLQTAVQQKLVSTKWSLFIMTYTYKASRHLGYGSFDRVTIISVLDVFGQSLLCNEAAEALPTAKNVCQWNIVAPLRPSLPYAVFINAYICVGEYSDQKQN